MYCAVRGPSGACGPCRLSPDSVGEDSASLKPVLHGGEQHPMHYCEHGWGYKMSRSRSVIRVALLACLAPRRMCCTSRRCASRRGWHLETVAMGDGILLRRFSCNRRLAWHGWGEPPTRAALCAGCATVVLACSLLRAGAGRLHRPGADRSILRETSVLVLRRAELVLCGCRHGNATWQINAGDGGRSLSPPRAIANIASHPAPAHTNTHIPNCLAPPLRCAASCATRRA